jgi:hypothetical protein
MAKFKKGIKQRNEQWDVPSRKKVNSEMDYTKKKKIEKQYR